MLGSFKKGSGCKSAETSLHPQILPAEILLKIFSYLNTRDLISASLTCVRFSEIVHDKSLLK